MKKLTEQTFEGLEIGDIISVHDQETKGDRADYLVVGPHDQDPIRDSINIKIQKVDGLGPAPFMISWRDVDHVDADVLNKDIDPEYYL